MIPVRNSYWNIDSQWIFYAIALISVTILFIGMFNHLNAWRHSIKRQKIQFNWAYLKVVFINGLLGKRIFKGDISAGLMHFVILWGFLTLFIGTLLISLDYWIFPFLKGGLYQAYEWVLDTAGWMLLLGIVWALIRRVIFNIKRLSNQFDDILILLWLISIVISGYLVEGARLSVQDPDWASWSYVGNALNKIFSGKEETEAIYPLIWWVHGILSLGFISYIPFSKLMHAIAAPINLYLAPISRDIIPVEERGEDPEQYLFRDAIYFDACTRCGRCVDVCPPAMAGEPFSPREFLLWARWKNLSKYSVLNKKFESETSTGDRFHSHRVWHCTTCGACLEVCPVYISPFESMRQVRSGIVEEGTEMPELLSQSLKYVYKYNNPWEATKKKKTKWATDLEIPKISPKKKNVDFCYFVGCTTSMETRAQNIARSFVKLLTHSNVSFGTLGKKEPCCGDIARRAGEDGLFEIKMEDCMDAFKKNRLKEIVTSSPHCFHTIRNEYPLYKDPEELEPEKSGNVRHYSQVLADLVQKGSIQFEYDFNYTVTFHDPCYLGRHNKIFEAPRSVLKAIPGINLVEMVHFGPNSLCCGGGGDRVWQEEMDEDPKMSEIRIREAFETGAQIIVTACPLCLIMLEDARKTAGYEDTLQIMDLNELVVKAAGI